MLILFFAVFLRSVNAHGNLSTTDNNNNDLVNMLAETLSKRTKINSKFNTNLNRYSMNMASYFKSVVFVQTTEKKHGGAFYFEP